MIGTTFYQSEHRGNQLSGTGDSWKALAEKYPSGAGSATQLMITRMNELWPFSSAIGIFDNGCGTGSVISHIIEKHGTDIRPSTKILAGDFSDPMLDTFRKAKQANTQKTGDAWERTEVRNMDAHDLSSIADNSVSHSTAGMVYFLLPDPRKALRETNRVLCPGGVIATANGKSSQHVDALSAAMESVRPGTNLALLSGVWTSEAGVKEELESTGFVDVETYLVDSEIKYENHTQFAEVLLRMPVMQNATEGFSDKERANLEKNLIEKMREINPAEPGKMTGVSLVALARKPSTPVS